MTKTMTDRAVSLLRRGWSVIPVHVPIGEECSCGRDCSWPGKHPRVPWREFTERRPSEELVREWFDDEFYGSNLGVVTGRVSDLAVVDLDGDTDEFLRLNLPETAYSRTGGGGLHFFYGLNGREARSGIGVVPGIDVKAEGGFVVLPPSRHVSGDRYRWVDFRKPTVIKPSQLPERARSLIEGPGEWTDELLTGVSAGERSIAAARLAGRYAQIGLTIGETVMLLVTWNDLNHPPLPQRELGATIRSVFKRHKSQQQNVTSLDDLLNIISGAAGKEVI